MDRTEKIIVACLVVVIASILALAIICWPTQYMAEKYIPHVKEILRTHEHEHEHQHYHDEDTGKIINGLNYEAIEIIGDNQEI